jgi:hypothetical protein
LSKTATTKSTAPKPEERRARAYADRLILQTITEMSAVVKLGDVAERLKSAGLGLATIRAFLASNPEKFAYAERRWIPAARLETEGRPIAEAIYVAVERFGGPMPIELLVRELALTRPMVTTDLEEAISRIVRADDRLFETSNQRVALAQWVFVASDQSAERALALNGVSMEEVKAAQSTLGRFNWRKPDAVAEALQKLAPIRAKVIGAVAWMALNPQDPHAILLYDWKRFNAELLVTEGYVLGEDGVLYPVADTKKWLSTAVKLAERIAPTVEAEETAPIEVTPQDVKRMVAKILKSDKSVSAADLLEEQFEITPLAKTYPDDFANVMAALQSTPEIWWVGGDRFRAPNTAPDYIYSTPELFNYELSDVKDEDGEFVDVELTDEGLSSTLRKLLSHPLAMDVNDEEPMPPPRTMPEQLRLVLKSIHRELGTFPLAQFPTGWLDAEPKIQELILRNSAGTELQVWVNLEARLIFGLIDWWLEQPIESGAVFSLSKTPKSNVLDFEWIDQADPVVFISSQRMEELRNLQAETAEGSALDILRRVMSHWPKGADFLTILWEVNVVRRSSRRLVASLLSSYPCFYQRSGSPVWHYDAKKSDLGIDKTKRKFVIKRR